MSNITKEGVIIKDKKTLERFREIINESTDIGKISKSSIDWYEQQKKAQKFLDYLNEKKENNGYETKDDKETRELLHMAYDSNIIIIPHLNYYDINTIEGLVQSCYEYIKTEDDAFLLHQALKGVNDKYLGLKLNKFAEDEKELKEVLNRCGDELKGVLKRLKEE